MPSGVVEMLSGLTTLTLKHEPGDYAELVDESRTDLDAPVAIRRKDGTLIAMMPMRLWDEARNATIKKNAEEWQRRNPELARIYKRAMAPKREMKRPGAKRRLKGG